ncbi:MAG TPA: 3-phosphoshikimate 1-carboxyvinyltransferase [Caulobacteraceae bacterium]|nr:3-phosphoshikimate 1-carboxyvinyltransferase [Caulobacteraceae bacterium]
MADPTGETLTASRVGPLAGTVRAPGDKSISHRALILGGLAAGVTEIEGLLEGADVLATARAVEALGARVERLGDGRWRIEGRGGFGQAGGVIDCGNSGTGVRLLMGAVSGFAVETRFDGDASLRSRPMGRVIDPLARMGARFETAEGARLPLTVSGGRLQAIDHIQTVASAQVKSAVLLAALNAEGVTSVVEPEPTRDHTERMLRAFGAAVDVGDELGGRAVRLAGGQRLAGTAVTVPGDPSSAAFPVVAGLVVPGSQVRLDGVLLNPLRTGLFETLIEMGADLSIGNLREDGGEAAGDIVAAASRLRGVTVPPARAASMIDEYPILAVAAAFAEGATVMRGIGELRVKESDRIALMARGLAACGVEVEEEPDGLVVHGRGRPPAGGATVATGGDHRIAMSHLVLGLGSDQPVMVDEAGMIATSFPTFVALMRSLGAAVG